MGVTCSNLVCIRGKNFCIRHTLFSPMWVCLYWPLLFLCMGGLLPVSCCQVSSLYNVWEIQPTRCVDWQKEISLIWWICILDHWFSRSVSYIPQKPSTFECYQHSFRWGFSFSCSLYVIGSRICVTVPLTWF